MFKYFVLSQSTPGLGETIKNYVLKLNYFYSLKEYFHQIKLENCCLATLRNTMKVKSLLENKPSHKE